MTSQMSQALASNPHQLAHDAHAHTVPWMRTKGPPPPDAIITSLLTEDEEMPASKSKPACHKKGKGKAVDPPRILEQSTEQVRGSFCVIHLLRSYPPG